MSDYLKNCPVLKLRFMILLAVGINELSHTEMITHRELTNTPTLFKSIKCLSQWCHIISRNLVDGSFCKALRLYGTRESFLDVVLEILHTLSSLLGSCPSNHLDFQWVSTAKATLQMLCGAQASNEIHCVRTGATDMLFILNRTTEINCSKKSTSHFISETDSKYDFLNIDSYLSGPRSQWLQNYFCNIFLLLKLKHLNLKDIL